MNQLGLLDIEPEPELDVALVPVVVGGEPESAMALLSSLPPDFPIQALLTFLPDVRLKQRVEAAATAALAVSVVVEGGLVLADEALVPVRDGLKEIASKFKDPVDLANQLHKRLTGLRADFTAVGEGAVKTVGQRIYAETQRLQRIADDAKRVAQEVADKAVRDAAAKAAVDAEKRSAPAAVVEALKERAATAVAPPVPTPAPVPVLANSAPTAKWRAKFVGTLPGSEPNPATKDLTGDQMASLMLLLRAIVDGRAPLALVDVNWSAANKKAGAEGTTMCVPGLEAFDEGGTRAKGRR